MHELRIQATFRHPVFGTNSPGGELPGTLWGCGCQLQKGGTTFPSVFFFGGEGLLKTTGGSDIWRNSKDIWRNWRNHQTIRALFISRGFQDDFSKKAWVNWWDVRTDVPFIMNRFANEQKKDQVSKIFPNYQAYHGDIAMNWSL